MHTVLDQTQTRQLCTHFKPYPICVDDIVTFRSVQNLDNYVNTFIEFATNEKVVGIMQTNTETRGLTRNFSIVILADNDDYHEIRAILTRDTFKDAVDAFSKWHNELHNTELRYSQCVLKYIDS